MGKNINTTINTPKTYVGLLIRSQLGFGKK